jgi:hypothetical protein
VHKHNADKIVREMLMQIAGDSKRPFHKVKKSFVRGNPKLTKKFWELLWEKYPTYQYTDVYHCPGCDQFDLE